MGGWDTRNNLKIKQSRVIAVDPARLQERGVGGGVKQTQDISLLRIFHLSNIVFYPYQSVQCVCVCVCVLSLIHI